MRIVIATDKFKRSLASMNAAMAIRDGVLNLVPNAEVKIFPMADGGDGFATVIKHYLNTRDINCETLDPLLRKINAQYQWDDKNSTAIIEIASASGLSLLTDDERNPMITSTEGTGIMMKDAIDRGAKNILLGLGGSATNDGGTGILQALGFKFINATGQSISMNGEALLNIREIVPPPKLPPINITIACDVKNPMFGENGAAYIYAAQKGADQVMIKDLDDGLQNFASILKTQTGKNISSVPGSGAAGAIAAGLMAFFPVDLKKGTQLIISLSGIERELGETDLIITGEGRLDGQSAEGKVVGEIAALAKSKAIKCVAICGQRDMSDLEMTDMDLNQIIELNDGLTPLEELINNAAEHIKRQITNRLRL